jgi:hypothetical protein
MAQATTYNIATNREDVMSGFTMVEPQATPLLSMLKKGRVPKASYTEWCVDNLEDPQLTAVDEGTDVSSFENPGANRARIGNHLQRQDRSWQVSDLEELVDDAVKRSEAKRNKIDVTDKQMQESAEGPGESEQDVEESE